MQLVILTSFFISLKLASCQLSKYFTSPSAALIRSFILFDFNLEQVIDLRNDISLLLDSIEPIGILTAISQVTKLMILLTLFISSISFSSNRYLFIILYYRYTPPEGYNLIDTL